MGTTKVLVVDDEPQIRHVIETGLSRSGYIVLAAVDGWAALDLIVAAEPDLVVLDLAMPLLGGLGVIARVREWSQVPIIVLSVRDDEGGKVEALDLGADDYLTKPFSMNELLARIRVALRHAGQRNAPAQAVLRAGALEMDVPRHVVNVDGSEVHLTPTEFDLLRVLLNNADRVVTQQQLLAQVWGAGHEADVQTLRIFIGQLRRKLKENIAQPHYIMTEPGVGYRLRREHS